ncbi:unnamed protein product, partial [Prorocentrum cordatum]
VQEADAAAEALPEEQPPPPAARRLLVRPEVGHEADALRQQVADARRRLEAYDREVTKLTKQLKQCRTAVWEQQRLQSASEAGLARLIAERIGELPPGTAEELQRADAAARELAQELSEARAQASRWSSMAKRQDTMLQQELEAAEGDAHLRLLARHPAGEVFMVRQYNRDMDSEDGYSDAPPRHGIRRQMGPDDADMTSEDETATTATGGGPLGLRPRVGVGGADSDSSSVPPSPSDGTGSASAGASGGVAASLAAAAAAGRGGAAQRKGDTSSDEDPGSPAQRSGHAAPWRPPTWQRRLSRTSRAPRSTGGGGSLRQRRPLPSAGAALWSAPTRPRRSLQRRTSSSSRRTARGVRELIGGGCCRDNLLVQSSSGRLFNIISRPLLFAHWTRRGVCLHGSCGQASKGGKRDGGARAADIGRAARGRPPRPFSAPRKDHDRRQPHVDDEKSRALRTTT